MSNYALEKEGKYKSGFKKNDSSVEVPQNVALSLQTEVEQGEIQAARSLCEERR